MMGRQAEQEQLFYRFRLEDHVPQDHLLRRIDWLLDLDSLRGDLAPLYSPIGRPSIDPELLIRMLLVGYLYGIRSETRLCQRSTSTSPTAGFAAWGWRAASPIAPAF
jgi:transposase